VAGRTGTRLLLGHLPMLAGFEVITMRHRLALVADLTGVGPMAQVT
jgi:hypothetical protein